MLEYALSTRQQIFSQSSANLYVTCILGQSLDTNITEEKGSDDRWYSDDQVNYWYT